MQFYLGSHAYFTVFPQFFLISFVIYCLSPNALADYDRSDEIFHIFYKILLCSNENYLDAILLIYFKKK